MSTDVGVQVSSLAPKKTNPSIGWVRFFALRRLECVIAQAGGLCMSQCAHWRILLFAPIPREAQMQASLLSLSVKYPAPKRALLYFAGVPVAASSTSAHTGEYFYFVFLSPARENKMLTSLLSLLDKHPSLGRAPLCLAGTPAGRSSTGVHTGSE